MTKVLLSLCIPTNGVLEWVIPVLESIYNQSVSLEYFEIIITDNGDNLIFNQSMLDYSAKYANLHYRKTNAQGFLNQIEAFNLANGIFLKFVNHRMPLRNGTLQYLVSFAQKYQGEKPIIYFSNGVLKHNTILESNNFDEFVLKLSYYSSWSAGLGIWREHFKEINLNPCYNSLFPHLYLLFFYRKHSKYIVDDTLLFNDLVVDEKLKGKYNLFYAFSVEYPSQLLDLLRKGDITPQTFAQLKKEIGKFLADLYINYIMRKKISSYDLTNYKISLSVFYDISSFKLQVLKRIFVKAFNKIVHY